MKIRHICQHYLVSFFLVSLFLSVSCSVMSPHRESISSGGSDSEELGLKGLIDGGYLSLTNANEITPFLYRTSRGAWLFFASDRHKAGDYDIWVAEMHTNGLFEQPFRMKNGLSTYADEISPVVFESSGNVYLSCLRNTNRKVVTYLLDNELKVQQYCGEVTGIAGDRIGLYEENGQTMLVTPKDGKIIYYPLETVDYTTVTWKTEWAKRETAAHEIYSIHTFSQQLNGNPYLSVNYRIFSFKTNDRYRIGGGYLLKGIIETNQESEYFDLVYTNFSDMKDAFVDARFNHYQIYFSSDIKSNGMYDLYRYNFSTFDQFIDPVSLTNTEPFSAVYVTVSNVSNQHGFEPDQPIASIQDAVSMAIKYHIDEIRLMSGTYVPGQGLNSSNTALDIRSSGLTLSGGWDSEFVNQNGISVLSAGANHKEVLKISGAHSLNLNRLGITGGSLGGLVIDHCTNVLIEGLVISNNHSEYGGGLYLSGSNISLISLTNLSNLVEENYALKSGGGGAVSGSDISIEGFFINNTASNSGGGLYVSNTVESVFSLNFISNRVDAPDSKGGAVFSRDSDSNTWVLTASDHEAVFGGAVFMLNENAGSLCWNLSENSALQSGGGFYLTNVSSLVIDGELANNYAARKGGGGFIHSSEKVIISNDVISNWSDSVTEEGGGGLYSESGFENHYNTVFFGNVSSNHGGGICLSRSTNAKIRSVFINCHAVNGGDALYLIDSPFTVIEESVFTNQNGWIPSADNGYSNENPSTNILLALDNRSNGLLNLKITGNIFSGRISNTTAAVGEMRGNVAGHLFSSNFFDTNELEIIYINSNGSQIFDRNSFSNINYPVSIGADTNSLSNFIITNRLQ